MGILDSVSNILSGGKNKQASGYGAMAADQFNNISLPDIEKMKLELEGLVSQGVLSPEDAKLYLQDNSELGGISLDPKLQQAQMDALASLQEIGDGGLTESDRANLNRIGTEELTRARGNREAIMQSNQARGMGGSGADLLAQLQNSQSAAERTSQRDMDVAGIARDRALQGIIQAGQLGGQMQNQSFNQQAQVAGAQDAINQFNTMAKQNTGNLNTQNQNAAAAQNLAEKQRIADSNVGTRNQQQQYNKNLQQQQFDNQIKKAGGAASAYQNQAANASSQGQGIQNLVGTGLMAGAMLYNPTKKKPGGVDV